MPIFPNFSEENKLWTRGFSRVVGIDEVGIGAWAGPLISAAVIFKPDTKIANLDDSKKLSPKKRVELANIIKERALCFSYGETSVAEINKFGLGKATRFSYLRALANLRYKPEFLLLDGNYNQSLDICYKSIVGGDRKVKTISAASILAKEKRDSIMKEEAKTQPNYKFGENKGYGTAAHQVALKKHGITELHRINYKPIKILREKINEQTQTNNKEFTFN